MMKTGFHKLLKWTLVDRAVLFAILARIWGICAGPITALLIATHLTPEIQGYFYTFGNILALQIFIELGLGTVILQFASHEWSRLRLDDSGHIVGDWEALSRLISIARVATKWYLVAGVLVTLGLGLGGYFFFSKSSSHGVAWFWPWVSLCALAGINICLVPLWSLLEGCNQVTHLYTYRFIQGACSSMCVWIALVLGAGLWVAPVAMAVSLICAAIFLLGKYLKFLATLVWARPTGPCISWYRDMLPMQWRIALSWMSGYFTFSIFTPVLFWYHGPVVAGQMGMTWSIASSVGIASSWLAPKVPQLGILVAQRKYDELDHLFWRITKIIIAISLAAACCIWLFVYVLNLYSFRLANRLLPPLPTTFFLLAQVVQTISGPFSSYMRAHKTEPIVHLSVMLGVLNGISAITLGRYFAAAGMGLGYLLINLMLAPLLLSVWRRERLKWRFGKVNPATST